MGSPTRRDGRGESPSRGIRATVIVPAHDEAESLPTCLGALVAQDFTMPFRVVVVANGCHDATGDTARAWCSAFRSRGCELFVLETARAAKAPALNIGEQLAVGDVRCYVDADVDLATDVLRRVFEALAQPGTLLAGPSISVRQSPSRIVRAYGRVWSQLPYIRARVIGCGFYAVSIDGRSRWTDFPDVLGDDKFVRLLFSEAEAAVVDSSITITLPTKVRELVAIRARWCRGNRQLFSVLPGAARADRRARRRARTVWIAGEPCLWPCLPVFATVYLLGLVASLRPERATGWARADSVRTAIASARVAQPSPRG